MKVIYRKRFHNIEYTTKYCLAVAVMKDGHKEEDFRNLLFFKISKRKIP